jgi:hypothetical protein
MLVDKVIETYVSVNRMSPFLGVYLRNVIFRDPELYYKGELKIKKNLCHLHNKKVSNLNLCENKVNKVKSKAKTVMFILYCKREFNVVSILASLVIIETKLWTLSHDNKG